MNLNPSYAEKRVRINKIQRNEIEEYLDSYRVVCSVISHASKQKMPVKSFYCLLDTLNTLENQLHRHGLPDRRLEEIKHELY